jgi:hypothetical protein
MNAIARQNLTTKVAGLLSDLPPEFNTLSEVILDSLRDEVNRLQAGDRERLERFRTLVTQLEALKMLTSQFYASKADVVASLRYGLFYQDLLPLILLFELWGKLWKDLDLSAVPNLERFRNVLASRPFRELRNAIAHGDVFLDAPKLVLNHRGKRQELVTMQITKLASCLSAMVALMGP